MKLLEFPQIRQCRRSTLILGARIANEATCQFHIWSAWTILHNFYGIRSNRGEKSAYCARLGVSFQVNSAIPMRVTRQKKVLKCTETAQIG